MADHGSLAEGLAPVLGSLPYTSDSQNIFETKMVWMKSAALKSAFRDV